MEPKQDDTETAPTATTDRNGGPRQVALDAMSPSATANSAIATLEHSENLAPDVDMADVFYFDVGGPSKEVLNPLGNANQKQPPATASMDELETTNTSRIRGSPGVNKKRKSPGTDPAFADTAKPLLLQPSKKARLENATYAGSASSSGKVKDKSLLPPEVWHRIFTFCPPKTLGNLLSVNKLFHDYLAPSSSSRCEHPKSLPNGESPLSPLQPNSIWKASRRLFWPNMPAPLRCMTELQMWKLICSTRCQECGRAATRDVAPTISNTEHGPGFDGVSMVWPLGIRVCGPCLLKKTVKEIDLRLSSTFASPLFPALPFALITKDLNVVSSSGSEQGPVPFEFETTKLYLQSDVEELEKEFASVKALGTGTMEEWFKGLPQRGQELLAKSRKWEKWGNSGGVRQVQSITGPLQSHTNSQAGTGAGRMPTSGQSAIPEPATTPSVRQGRTKEEVEALKADRKAEIERRVASLDPPIQPDVLEQMSTFQAAILISAPLDEKAWNVLMPRLLAERLSVTETVDKTSEATRSREASYEKLTPELPSHLEATLASTKAAKDAIDQQWEEVQAPLRAEIVRYADEYIRDSWNSGDKVNKDNCSRFAAETLVHIRKRFYDRVAQDAVAAKAAGKNPVEDPPEGPFTQKLTLENMKWIFEYKIKPLTQPFKKEIFYCNGCPGKPFGFEGVNQHYAAKHTSALSSGNIVVHWRAEWPEVPPFQPEGRSKPVVPVSSLPALPFTGPSSATTIPPQTYNANTYIPQPLPVAPSAGQFYVPGQPPGSTYPSQPYPGPYGQQHPAFQGPPPAYPPGPPGIPPSQPPTTWTPAAPPPFNLYPSARPPTNAFPAPPAYQQPMLPVPPLSAVVGPYSYPPGGYTPAPKYKFQLESIARDSREVWNATNNIKDLPGSVRVQTIIFHVVKRFRSKFSENPSLAMFQDGLSNNKDMRSLRHINALVCKACLLSLGNAPSIEKDRDSYSLPQLVNHFQSKHVELMVQTAPSLPPLDWTIDMISLPGHHDMARLPNIIGADIQKRKLFSDAFPEFFEPPAPMAVPAPHGNAMQPAPSYQLQPAHSQGVNIPSSIANHEKFYGPNFDSATRLPPVYSQGGDQQGNRPPHNYGQAPALSNYAAAVSAAPAAAANDTPGPFEHGSLLSQNKRALNGVDRQPGNNSSKNTNARAKDYNNGDASRKQGSVAARNDRCRKCSKRGHYARECPENNAQKDIKVQVEVEEQRREQEIRAIWAADRANLARSERRKEQQAAAQKGKAHPPHSRGNNRSGHNHPAQQEDARSSEVTRSSHLRVTHPPRQESNLLDVLDMHLDQAERERPAYQDRMLHGSHLPDIERAPEGPHRSGGGYYDQPRPDHQPSPLPRYQEPQDTAYRELPPRGMRRVAPTNEYRNRRGPEPVAAHPEMPRLEPPSHERRYREEEVVYERVSSRDYRPISEAFTPTSRPTGQLYEIVEVEDEQGRYLLRRPIGFAPPPPRYDYEYEQEDLHPRAVPVRDGGRPLHPEAEPYVPREFANGYESDDIRGAPHTHALTAESTYSTRRTPAPERAYSRTQQGPVGGHYPHLPREEYPVAQATRNHEGRVLRQYGEEEEYDPRNPAVSLHVGGHRGGPNHG